LEDLKGCNLDKNK